MLDKLAHLFIPHYSNNHRPKIIQNAGLTALVAIFIVAEALLRLTSFNQGVGGFVLGYASSITPSQIVELTNQQRTAQGLTSLTHNASLSNAAAAKANHMFAQQYWAHIAPDGTSPWFFIKNAGYSYSVAGENLARDFGDSGSVVTAWMNSPTHRDNIVSAKYKEIGVAVVDGVLNGVETTLVVQMFGTSGRVASAVAPQKAVIEPKPAPVAIEATPAPTAEPVVENTPADIPIEEVTLVNDLTLTAPAEASKLRISPLMITKVLATSIVALVLLVLAYDLFVVHQKKLVRLVGKNWAHFGFFGVLLLIMYLSTAGRII
jgi:hypothetical protein